MLVKVVPLRRKNSSKILNYLSGMTSSFIKQMNSLEAEAQCWGDCDAERQFLFLIFFIVVDLKCVDFFSIAN